MSKVSQNHILNRMNKNNIKKQLKKQHVPGVLRYERFVEAKDYVVFKLVKKNESEKVMRKFNTSLYKEVKEVR